VHPAMSVERVTARRVHLEKSVQESTMKKFNQKLIKWELFLASQDIKDIYMREEEDYMKIALLIDFSIDLQKKGNSSNEVAGIFSAVRNSFKINCINTAIFDNESVKGCKESIRRVNARQENIEKEKRIRLPVTVDFIQEARQQLWNTNKIDTCMIYIGMSLAFNFMWRASEYIMDNKNTHAILSDDVIYIVNSSIRYRTWDIKTVLFTPAISSILFVIRSSKSDARHNGRYLHLSRKSILENQLLDDLIWWAINSKQKSGEPFLSRWFNNRMKKLTRKMLTDNLRMIAERLGFKNEMVFAFKPHSLRIGGATTRMSAGGSREVTKRIGGWGYDSSCDQIYYMNTALDEGALSMSRTGIQILTSEHVHQLVPPSLLGT
jgi:hypothetical protein